MNVYRPKLHATLWLLMMLAVIGLGAKLLRQNWLETGFLALLPPSEQQPEVAQAIARHNEQRDRKMIWLAGGKTAQTAIENARLLKQELALSKLFSDIILEVPQQQYRQRYRQLFPFRYQLLDDDSKRLLAVDPEALLTQNQALIYGPMGQMAAADLEHDPLLLFSRYQQAQTRLKVNLVQGIAVIADQNQYWALLLSELEDSRLQLDRLEILLTLVKKLHSDARANGNELLVTGMPLFTADGADSAKREISTVGLGSSIGILVVMLLTFRSPRPLLLSFLAIGSGLVAAWVISVWIFGKIHIITLVFGASLIGVADDYALHYVCDSFSSKNWQPRSGLRHIFFGLLTGLLTNLLSYSGLVFSPFPGLREVALFSAVGLLTAWLTVIMLFPLLLTGFNPGHRPLMFTLADNWQQHWPQWLTKHRRWLMPLTAIIILGGLYRLTPNDDVRLLQAASQELTESAEKIKQLMPVSPDNQFFLVSGRDMNDWHRNEQRLLTRLTALTHQQKLKAFDALSAHWPDENTQHANYRLLDQALYQSGLTKRYMTGLGFSKPALEDEYRQFNAAANRTLSLPEWLKTADENQQALWLGCNAERCISRVSLTGITGLAELASLQNLTGVAWVNQVGQLSELFQRYRIKISILIAAAYVLVYLGLGVKFGWRKALAIIAVPVTAALFSLAMSGWCGQLFSLFNLFALLLVLGIGVDDAVFFAMTGANGRQSADAAKVNKRGSTALAVTLSAITTLLAFGLLAVSSTEVVHAFGFTVGTGILAALLCAPLIGYKRSEIALRENS